MSTNRAIAVAGIIAALMGGSGAWAQEWQETQSREGNFSVLLPGKSIYLAQRVDSDLGELVWHTYAAETRKGDVGWIASYVEFPAWYVKQNGEKQILDIHVDQLRAHYRVRSDKAFSAAGISGREVRMAEDTEGVHFEHFLQLFLSGNRLYKLHVAGKDTLPPQEDLTKFVCSFRWLRSK